MKQSETTIYIRTEANSVIASGHMMRCLSIADAAREMGMQCIFIVAESGAGKLPKQRGYEVICLNRRWDDFGGEIPVMRELIKKHNIGVLLVDSYFVSQDYMEELHRLTKTAYIDDLHASVWPCSMLIDYAVYSDFFPYEKEYPEAQLLLGCSYMPLRKEYKGLPKRILRQEIQEVLMLTGGSDPQHFMLQAVDMIQGRKEWNGIHFTLVCGLYNEDLERLLQRTAQEEQITVLPSLPTLKEALLSADLAVTAGGTTLYEMAACGTPGIVFGIADNQKWNVKAFAEKNLALSAGMQGDDFSIGKVAEQIDRMRADFGLRKEMSQRLQALVDGNGAARIARKLSEYAK